MSAPLAFPAPRRLIPHRRPIAYLTFGVTGFNDRKRPICQGLNEVTLQDVAIPPPPPVRPYEGQA